MKSCLKFIYLQSPQKKAFSCLCYSLAGPPFLGFIISIFGVEIIVIAYIFSFGPLKVKTKWINENQRVYSLHMYKSHFTIMYLLYLIFDAYTDRYIEGYLYLHILVFGKPDKVMSTSQYCKD